jgi:nucleotide-binding universal stress UspA family protein
VKLLLAVDIHDDPEGVLAEGCRWAERLAGTLDVAFVDEYQHHLFLEDDPEKRTLVDEEWSAIQAEKRDALRALVVRHLPDHVRGELLYLTGRAADAIVEAARTRDAVLVANCRRRGLGRALRGSVTERVVRRAAVPVITFRRRPTSSASGSS